MLDVRRAEGQSGWETLALRRGDYSGRIMALNLRQVEGLTIRFLVVYALVILCYSAATALSAPTGAPHCPVGPICLSGLLLSIGGYVAVLAAAVTIGGLLGFLFGIPRLLQRRSQAVIQSPGARDDDKGEKDAEVPEPMPSSSLSRFAGNTNLEDISDWLTKIMVGLGLTQIASISDAFRTARTEFVESAMSNAVGSGSMFAATVVCGLVIGFLFFYLETRTRLTILLASADHFESHLLPGQEALAQALRTTRTEAVLDEVRITLHSPEASAPTAADRQIAKVPFDELQTVDELAVWGAAQDRLGNAEAAERAFAEAIRKAPNTPKLYLALAAVRKRFGENEKAAETLNSAARRFSDNPTVLKDTLLSALYVPPPAGYAMALAAAEQLQRVSPQAMDDPQVQLWVAAANGQKYAAATDEAEKAEAEAAALRAVENVVRLAPEPGHPVRNTLRKIFNPAEERSNPTENDLEVFKNSDAFRSLIKP